MTKIILLLFFALTSLSSVASEVRSGEKLFKHETEDGFFFRYGKKEGHLRISHCMWGWRAAVKNPARLFDPQGLYCQDLMGSYGQPLEIEDSAEAFVGFANAVDKGALEVAWGMTRSGGLLVVCGSAAVATGSAVAADASGVTGGAITLSGGTATLIGGTVTSCSALGASIWNLGKTLHNKGFASFLRDKACEIHEVCVDE